MPVKTSYLPGALQHQMAGDLSLCCVAIDACFSHKTASNSFTFSSTAMAPFSRSSVTSSSRRGFL